MLSALLAGCADSPRPGQSGQDGPPAITLNFDGEAVPFEPTYATFSTYRKNLVLTDAAIANPQERVPATVHRILLANYDLQAARAGLEDFRRIHSPGQFRVDIQIEAGMDTPADAPIRPASTGRRRRLSTGSARCSSPDTGTVGIRSRYWEAARPVAWCGSCRQPRWKSLRKSTLPMPMEASAVLSRHIASRRLHERTHP